LVHPAGLALSLSHRLDCGSSPRRINREPGSSPAPFGPSGSSGFSIQRVRLWAAESSKRSLAPRTMRMTWQQHYSPVTRPTRQLRSAHNLSALRRGMNVPPLWGCRGVRRLRALATLAKS
jgi:hypothetical protein